MGIQQLYQYGIFYLMYALLILFVVFIILEFKIIKKKIKLSRKTWLLLLLIFLIGAIIRVFVFPHFHLMYIDEPWYMEMAKNMNQGNGPVVCEYIGYDNCYMPFKPPCWPFLLSITQLIFGLGSVPALYMATVIGSLSIILVFFLSYLVFNEKTALWASFFLALTPIHIIWSNSAETNSISVFFVLASLILFLISVKSKRILASLFPLLMFTMLVRFENMILIGIFILLFPYKKIQKFIDNNVWLLFILLLAPIVIMESIVHEYLRYSTFTLAHYYLPLLDFLQAASFNYMFLILSTLCIYSKKKIRTVLISFISFFIIYLPIFSEDRMVLVPSVFLMILAAQGIESLLTEFKFKNHIRVAFALVFLVFFTFSLVSERTQLNKYKNNMLETEAAAQIAQIDGYIIIESPTIINSISDAKTISTAYSLAHPEVIQELTDVYYFYDGFCTTQTIADSQGAKGRCTEILKYNYEIVDRFGDFILFKFS